MTSNPGPATHAQLAAMGWHLLTAAAVATGLVWQLVLQVQGVNILVDETGQLPSLVTRLVRFFSYFTIQSNILVAAIAVTLAVNPSRDGRVWRVLRLESLFGITLTGVVYSTLLRGVVDLQGAAAVTNALLHYVSPLMTVIGWFMFGPRPRITENTLLAALIWPALYVTYILGYGAAVDWYPYPFIDVRELGYATALRNGIGLNVLMVGVGALYLWLDHHLPVAPGQPPPQPGEAVTASPQGHPPAGEGS